MPNALQLRQRKSFTDLERQRLRLYHHTYPSLTPEQLASWFESETGRRVSKSSVYDILSEKYAYLDNTEATDAVRKKKGPQWAELEDALFTWWQGAQPRDVTGKELKVRANEIWQTLPTCMGKKVPTFSDGWLSSWRVRHGLAQSTRSVDVDVAACQSERTQKIPCTINVSAQFVPRSIPSAQLLDLTSYDFAPPFTVTPAGRLCPADMTFTHSQHPNISGSEFACTSPSMMHFCSPLVSASQSNSDLRPLENQRMTLLTQGQHRAKRLKVTGSWPWITTNFQDTALAPKPPQTVIPFHQTPWKGVQELFSECNALKGHGLTIPGNVVTNFLRPILNCLEYPEARLKPRRSDAFNVENVFRLFFTLKDFRVQLGRDESQYPIFEDWFLDYINLEILRSQPPESDTIEEQSPSNGSPMRLIPRRRPRETRCLTTNVSYLAKDGQVHIFTRTYQGPDMANGHHEIHDFEAKIVITPPTAFSSVPQTTLDLVNPRLPPTITFRKVIPADSTIFKIARFGTSTELQMILSSVQASLSDCDPEGRSLINYALQMCNHSTLKFLLTTVEDIDAYETSIIGKRFSLIGMLARIDKTGSIFQRSDRLTCLKLMLLADADALLDTDNQLGVELKYGALGAVKALLDICPHYLNAAMSLLDESPLLYLLRQYFISQNSLLDVSEKVTLILERGADVAARNIHGETCIHAVLMFDANLRIHDYQEEVFKDFLMCLVTAGADICAACSRGTTVSQTTIRYGNEEIWREVLTEWRYDPAACRGTTVSQTAIRYGNEEIWREVLAECGYDPDSVFSLEKEFSDFQKHPGMGIFSAMTHVVRSTRLSFAEYGKQRKSLDSVKKVYNPEDMDVHQVLQERRNFKRELFSSWTTNRSIDDDEYHGGNEEYPELLHEGVHWLSAFS